MSSAVAGPNPRSPTTKPEFPKCLVYAPTYPLGCYEESRFENYDQMMEEVMSVYDPAGDWDVRTAAAGTS